MADFCTCGAQLPPDALFCHKCGKPQRDIGASEPESPPVPPPVFTPPPVREAPPLNFHNPVVLRVALTIALATTILNFVLPFLNWIAGGFFAVLFYRRRTGSLLNVSAGVHLGWITGILAFVPSAILFSIQFLTNPGMVTQGMRNLPTSDPRMLEQITQLLKTGPGMAAALALFLVVMFVMITLLTMAGGALGAKMTGRQ
jgi:hypothetical protein